MALTQEDRDLIEKIAADRCRTCGQHSGIEGNLLSMTENQRDLRKSGGTIDRIWKAIEARVTKVIFTSVMVAAVGFLGTMFAMLYSSQERFGVAVTTSITQLTKEMAPVVPRLSALETRVEGISRKVEVLMRESRH